MKLDILYQSSTSYAIPAAVSVCSLFENNKDITLLQVWFVDAGLTGQDRMYLKKLAARYGRNIEFLTNESVDEMLSEAGVELWSGSYATFYKLFIWNRFQETDRVLYIDADTLVLGSLESMCNFEMENYACAMAASAMTGTVKDFLGVEDYFNAGVILFNLDYWKKNHTDKDFLEVVKSERCSRYTVVGDESLINYVLKGKIKKLPLKYNFESSWWLWGWNRKLDNRLGWNAAHRCYYSDHEIANAKDRPCIAHYVDLTTGRPWDVKNDNLFREEFEQYCRIVKPWKNMDFAMRGMGGNHKLAILLKYFVKKGMPFSIRSRLGFYQHDLAWKKKLKKVKCGK